MSGSKHSLNALVGGIQKFSVEDGPGIRTTVFLKGCPLSCVWCHNPELIDFAQDIIRMPSRCIGCGYCVENCPRKAVFITQDGKADIYRDNCDTCGKCAEICYSGGLKTVAKGMTVDDIMAEVEQDKGFYEHTGGGLTISGGEILSHKDFVSELIEESGRRGISVCLDTSGYGDGALLESWATNDYVTNVLYDIKNIIDDEHIKYTGQSNARILDNLVRLTGTKKTRDKLILRMPLVMGINDSDEAICAAADFYRKHDLKKLTLLPYHSLGVSKKKHLGGVQRTFDSPEDKRMEEIKRYFIEHAEMEVEILGKNN